MRTDARIVGEWATVIAEDSLVEGCWHCGGQARCGCIACAQAGDPSREERTCKACLGTRFLFRQIPESPTDDWILMVQKLWDKNKVGGKR